MGWLDNLLGVNDPSQAASLALGTNLLSTGGPSRMPISTGQAIGNALMGARDTAVGTQNDILKRQLVQAQIQHQLMALKELQRLQTEQQQARDLLTQFVQTPGAQASSLPGGPTVTNAAKIPQMPGGLDVNAFRNAAMAAGNLYGVELAPKLAKPVETPIMLKKGEVALQPGTYRKLAENKEDVEQWINIGQNDRGQLLQKSNRTGEIKAVGQGPLIGSISVGDKSDNSFLKALSDKEAARVSSMLDAGDRAAQSNASLDRIAKIVESPAGLTTGPMIGDLVNKARQIGAAVNFPIDVARLQNDSKYEIEIRGNLADAILNSSVGRSMTDADREYLKQAFVSRDVPLQSLPATIQQLRHKNNMLIRRAEDIRSKARTHFSGSGQNPFVLSEPPPFDPAPGSPSIDVQTPKVIDFNSLPTRR